ncbi:hypothetical protein [Bacillus sp. PS06]|uniref:hypothetical protein n=1 Tax=Bacillus sp. PS06 TaxID=2764176 RepID=UPI0017840486|nr:hypothetical protein [Bacillus sp. PS06]MBD8071501.1 hypothetical protein [Bacillus sp. PS06]
MNSEVYKNMKESVEHTRQAVIKAQSSHDAEAHQQAQYQLSLSKQWLREIEEYGELEEIAAEIHRIKEDIKHLSEAYESIRAY